MTTYAITGHTYGIGQRAFERLSPNIIGFARSTGYDITNTDDRQKIVNESMHCDVFINNANFGFGATHMLIEIARAWANFPEKKIINVGSKIAEVILPINDIFAEKHNLYYQAQKASLKTTHYNLLPLVKCQMSYKWFSYVGTESILRKYPHFTSTDYITEDQAVDIILS
jgi:hypothetical protein